MLGWEIEFLRSHRVARLATLGEGGQPHVVPIVYAYDGERLFTPIDGKPKQVAAYRLQRVKDILSTPRVAILVDDYMEDWSRLAWVQVRGRAEVISGGDRYHSGIDLLKQKYPQYESLPLDGRPLILIHPERILGWRPGR